MKKIFLSFILFAFLANVSAQLEVNSLGDTYVAKNIYLESASNFLGTTNNNVPFTFKVNDVLAGFTGSTGKAEVSFGYGALSNSLSKSSGNSVAIGIQALYSNTYGSDNVAIGYQALFTCTSSYYNVAIGSRTLQKGSGSFNTATGFQALQNNMGGGNNTATGSYALFNNATGSQNTAIGFYADVSADNLSNTIAIGYNAKTTTSNQVVIGNNSITSFIVSSLLSLPSDGRAKKNIQTNVPGLAFIKHLQPVTYNLDLNALDELQKSDDPKINALQDSLRRTRSPEAKEIEAKARANKEKQVYSGFIAQDVEKAARSIGYDFIGVDAPENNKGVYGLRYAAFVVPLVKAVQELSEQNDQLKGIIDELQQKVEKMEANTPVISLRSDSKENSITDLSNAVIEQCKLYQNAPNPFTHSTEIKYYLPDDVSTAFLCIYNLQGRELKQMNLIGRGDGSQMIHGHELPAGMYLYALIVEGKEVDTKRMILTK